MKKQQIRGDDLRSKEITQKLIEDACHDEYNKEVRYDTFNDSETSMRLERGGRGKRRTEHTKTLNNSFTCIQNYNMFVGFSFAVDRFHRR
jgi:hypothetical protein